MEALLGDPRVVRCLTGWVEQLAADPDALNTDDVLPLVEELGLRWPWCVVGLLEVFHRMVLLKITDPREALPPVEAAVMAPAMVLTFRTEVGEATDVARERLTEIYAQSIAALDSAEAAAAGGHMPRRDAHLRMRGRWFYEARVAVPQKSITALAAANHGESEHFGRFEDCDCRKQVRDGIREAERLLNLGEYVLRPPGKNQRPGASTNSPPGE